VPDHEIIHVDSARLNQQIPVPVKRDAVINDPRIFESSGKAEAWFNASTAIINGKRIMVYRVEARPYFRFPQLAFVELDEHWQPIESTNKLLDLRTPTGKVVAEDPRLFKIGNQWHMAYTDSWNQAVCDLDDNLNVSNIRWINYPLYSQSQVPQKNWTFFECNGEMIVVKHILPHNTGSLINGHYLTRYVFVSNQWSIHRIPWRFGQMRGGACPVLHDGLMWSFFHSHTLISDPKWLRAEMTRTPWWRSKAFRQYHIGIYVFEPTPPFKVVGLTRSPILSAPIREPAGPIRPSLHRVVFPCSAIREQNSWLVTMGWNDSQIKHVRFKDSDINIQPIQ
jgi:predicted GH43/DUF377 family glycosyl hydrolase